VTTAEWGIVIGVVMSALLALTPWMFMVHAKLAVLASQMANLEDKVDKLIEANEQRLPMCASHATQLDTHHVQIGQISERLRDIE
jgi:tetrahydromethanopterin S-methyltransferase subunit B